MTRGHNSTWNYDLGSKVDVILWPRVRIQYWIVIPIPGHNVTLNPDSGSNATLNSYLRLFFNVESRPGVIIQRGPNLIRRRGSNTMTPCLGGRNSTWKIRWFLSTTRWIKTSWVEIQWGQNSILHRTTTTDGCTARGWTASYHNSSLDSSLRWAISEVTAHNL